MARRRGWHPEDIKAAVRKRGSSLTDLAKAKGLHESACRAALRRSQPAAEGVIAEFLDIPLHTLWPDRYAPGGARVSRHKRDGDKSKRDAAHRLTAGPA